MELLLLTTGGFFAVVFVIYSLLQIVTGNLKIGFFGTLLAFLATLVPLTGVIFSALNGQQTGTLNPITIGIAILFIVGGAILMLLERIKPQTPDGKSRGILGVGAGSLLVVSTVTVPMVVGSLMPPASASDVDLMNVQPAAIVLESGVDAVEGVENDAPMLLATNTPMPNPTATRPPAELPQLPTLEPTRDRSVPATPAPDTVASVAPECYGVVSNNLNLRGGPSTTNDILLTIPHSSHVDLNGRTDDGGWLSVNYDGEAGWVSADYITLQNCGDLPVVQP